MADSPEVAATVTVLAHTIEVDTDSISPDCLIAALQTGIEHIQLLTSEAQLGVNWNTFHFGIVPCEADPSTSHLRFEMEPA